MNRRVKSARAVAFSWALIAIACGEKPASADALTVAQVAETATFETLQSLGSHRTEALTLQKQWVDGGVPEERDSAVVLSWDGPERFQWRTLRDGKLRQEILLAEGAGWVRSTNRPYALLDSLDVHKAALGEHWEIWDTALEPFKGRVDLQPAGDGLVEGRTAWHYTVGLLPAPANARDTRTTLTSLEGSVWIDKATAVRLIAEVSGAWTTQGRRPLHHSVEFSLIRSGFGEPQGVRPPFEMNAASDDEMEEQR